MDVVRSENASKLLQHHVFQNASMSASLKRSSGIHFPQKTKSHQKDRKFCHCASPINHRPLETHIQLDNPRLQSWPREKSRFHERKYFAEVIWVYSRDPSLLLPHFRCHQCLPQVSHWDPGHEASHFTQRGCLKRVSQSHGNENKEVDLQSVGNRILIFLTLCEMEGTSRVNWNLNDRWTWLSMGDVDGSNHVKQITVAAHARPNNFCTRMGYPSQSDYISFDESLCRSG